ncbi:Histone-lysine N-methyltransferase ASH1L [Tolypocladium ophioglossoides CBS 100239]|uniref:Histone-lysine N-methyltransferase ASH1L n=1 Tax=Tolypocladium ophioglossoides (strain CBS 100239) TaxID=1163406 RepID=A0A0L0NCU3_TOLOC|nr:Histone-lysine N-methyltransferase ASH1L [Tolypocladium ophioglossoides CBS 100239]
MSMSLFAESGSFSSGIATDTSSNVASSGSTPPTTVADSASLHSDTSKHDVITVADDAADAPVAGPHEHEPEHDEPESSTSTAADISKAPSPPSPARRAKRARVSTPVYNLAKLSGTDGHGKRRAKGDVVADRRRRTISGDTLVGSIEVGAAAAGTPSSATRSQDRALKAGIDALQLQWSPAGLDTPRTRRQARLSPAAQRASAARFSGVSTLGSKLSTMGRRGRKAVDKGLAKMSRELRRLQDTNEFTGVDDRPVLHTVWSNGKYVDPKEPVPPARKKAKVEPAPEPEKEESEPITNTRKRRVKKYLDKGLYAGQDAPLDMSKGLTMAEKKKLAQLPELIPSGRVNKTMPLPIYTGVRMLLAGRDFKLPYQICNPLPPGQPKPDEWKKMTKNRFIGDSKDYWRKLPHLHDYQSKCVCKPEDGCGESCQNRIMLYECDATNCNVGEQFCTNRAFQDLTARRAKGGKYRVGVEVIKTSDRGYGVRSNRCFRPNQIIMEYAGEIFTEEECERRMNEVYKDNECYYLMSFDQNMIIDATTGSIARFVNHSCNPNCRMIKWIVSGQPRMALFAGDRPIMTGDELTYDYNFDPFSAKNVQICLCGEHNCRGVLGPKPREVKPPKTDLKKVVKATVKAGKRKLKELLGDDEADNGKAKKRKIQPAKGVKRSLSNASLKAAKGAATALKKGVSSITVNAKKAALGAKAAPAKRRASTGGLIKKKSTKVVKTYGQLTRIKQVSSRASSLTIVAMGDEKTKWGKKSPAKGTPAEKVTATTGREISAASSARQSSTAKIRVVSQEL